MLAAVKSAGHDALKHASKYLRDDSYLKRLAEQAGRPMRLRALLEYARDLREANIKAKVDLALGTGLRAGLPYGHVHGFTHYS